MAGTLAETPAGQEFTMKNGVVIISDGRGGGTKKRAVVKKPAAQTKKVVSNSSLPIQAPAAPAGAAPVQGSSGSTAVNTVTPVTGSAAQKQADTVQPNTVQTGLRKLANQGNTLEDLVKQTKGRPR